MIDISSNPFWYSPPIIEVVNALYLGYLNINTDNIKTFSCGKGLKLAIIPFDIAIQQENSNKPKIEEKVLVSITDNVSFEPLPENVKVSKLTSISERLLTKYKERAYKVGLKNLNTIPFSVLLDVRNILHDSKIQELKKLSILDYEKKIDTKFWDIIAFLVKNDNLKTYEEMLKNNSELTKSVYKTNIADIFFDIFSNYIDVYSTLRKGIISRDKLEEEITALQKIYSISDELKVEILEKSKE